MDNDAIIDDFKNYCRRTGLMPCSVNTYVKIIKKFIENAVGIYDTDSYIMFLSDNMMDVDRRSDNYYFAILKFLKYLKNKNKGKRIIENIVRILPKPPQRDPKRTYFYMSKDMRNKIIVNIKSKKHKIVAFLQFVTGWRIGDILRLRYGDINYEMLNDRRILRISTSQAKGQKVINAYVGDEDYIEIIEKFVKVRFRPIVFDEIDEYMFLETQSETDSIRKIIHSNYCRYIKEFKASLRKLDIDPKKFSSHDMKRSMARDIWEKYKDITVVQQILNHSRVETTVRYLRHTGINIKDVYLQHQGID